MGYGSHALDLLGKYYEGRVASLSEGQLHVDPITCIDPDQVALYLVPTILSYMLATAMSAINVVLCNEYQNYFNKTLL